MTAILILFLVTLLAAAAAVALMLRAGARDRQDEALLRVRALGGDEVAALTAMTPREGRIKSPILRWVCHVLWRSGSEAEPETVQRMLWILGLAVPFVLLLVGWFAGLFVIGLVVVVGFVLLSRQGAIRRNKVVEQLPPFLEGVMRVLSAGNTLEESIASAARESPEPLRTLFMSVGRQVRLGAPVEQVLLEMGEIHQLRDVKVMSMAAAINRKYGGSLKNIIKSLIQTIRSRDTAARELRALTAETRFSAVVLAVIPVGISLYIAVQNRQYYANMWADSAGRILLIFSVALQIMGVLVIWRMMSSTEDAA